MPQRWQYSVACLMLVAALDGQKNNSEFRATWVVTWEHIDPDASTDANIARAKGIIKAHADANMNAILWQARQAGTAYYQSSYEPWGAYAGGGG